MYFNIKCIGKLSGPTNEFERSQVFETGEFERPKFDCNYKMTILTRHQKLTECKQPINYSVCTLKSMSAYWKEYSI